MPYTMNGIGTWYYGKKNASSYQNYCPHCNHYVTLSSYDTREWFVILFVPIIPLAQKRVMDSCPRCSQHRQVPLKKYRKLKGADYTDAMECYVNAPNDPEAVGNLLEIFGAYQDMEAFEDLVPKAAEQFSNDPKVQASIGSVYYNYGRMEQALPYFERSLSLHDDDDIHEIVGFAYLRMSDTDRAEAHFRHIIDRRISEKAGRLLALVDGYQGTGRHQDAIELLDIIIEMDPSMAKQKEYKKTRKLSEKNLHSNKPIKSKQGVQGQSRRREKTPVNSKKAWAIAGAVVVAAILVVMVMAFYCGMHPTVYLVNGLARSYEVTLNDKTYTMPKYGYRKIAIPEGDVQMSAAGLGIAEQSLKLQSSFLWRPFMKRVYVINPDQVAPVLWAKMYYAVSPDRAPETQWKLYIGESFYVFDEIGLPFKEFPDEISLSSASTVESRQQITMLPESEVRREDLPNVISEHLGNEVLVTYLQKNLYYEPENDLYLNQLSYCVESLQFIEIIRDGLDAKPVRINWHRAYQGLVPQVMPEVDLVKEYQARLQNDPDNPALQYLMGRVIEDDNKQAVSWLNKSVSGPTPCAYGYHALGYHAAASGEFDAAQALSEKSLQTDPDNRDFAPFYFDMLIATGKMDAALYYCRMQKRKNSDFMWVSAETEMLVSQGQQPQAKGLYVQYYEDSGQALPAETVRQLQKANEIECAYIEGDFQTYLQIVGEPNDLWTQLILTLNLKDSAPDTFLESLDAFSPSALLMLYVSETRLGNMEKATLFLDEAMKQLAQAGYNERCVAACLKSGAATDIDRIYQMSMTTQLKSVVLTALGTRYPEHQQRLFELAERLNFRKVFPYHYLEMVHAESVMSP